MQRINRLWQWFIRNDNNEVIIAEKPNLPIIGALAAIMLAIVLPDGGIEATFRVCALVLCAAWAILEIVWGHSPIRRAMGATALMIVAAIIFW